MNKYVMLTTIFLCFTGNLLAELETTLGLETMHIFQQYHLTEDYDTTTENSEQRLFLRNKWDRNFRLDNNFYIGNTSIRDNLSFEKEFQLDSQSSVEANLYSSGRYYLKERDKYNDYLTANFSVALEKETKDWEYDLSTSGAVSYTHLTLPTN